MIEAILLTNTIEGENGKGAIPCDKTVRRISGGKMKEVVVIEGEEFELSEFMDFEVVRQDESEVNIAIEEVFIEAGRVYATFDLSLIEEDTRKSWSKSSNQRFFLAFDEDEEGEDEDVKPAPKASEKAPKGDTKNG